MTDRHIQTVIVGSGAVGLAIARKFARRGHEVLVLEAESSGHHHTSARNSQVIHSGLLYPAGSLKAQLCVAGRAKLYDFCETRHIDHARCEKLIIATDEAELSGLHAICERGRLNGVADLRVLTGAEVTALEPDLHCLGAVLSPSTGIVDATGYMNALAGEAQARGAMFAYHARLETVRIVPQGFALEIADADRTQMTCTNLVNAAGLGAWDVARQIAALPADAIPHQSYVKAGYYTLASGHAPFQRLIYPSPDATSLPVHAIRDTSGQVRIGPTTTYLDPPRIDYRHDTPAGALEGAIRKFWPDLPYGALQPDTCGIRPRITPRGAPLADFMIAGPDSHGMQGLVQLFGIESPGLTSSLAIADHVWAQISAT